MTRTGSSAAWVGVIAGFFLVSTACSAGSDSGSAADCAGSIDCACYGNQTCDAGLTCNPAGVCEPNGSGLGGGSSGTGGSAGTASTTSLVAECNATVTCWDVFYETKHDEIPLMQSHGQCLLGFEDDPYELYADGTTDYDGQTWVSDADGSLLLLRPDGYVNLACSDAPVYLFPCTGEPYPCEQFSISECHTVRGCNEGLIDPDPTKCEGVGYRCEAFYSEAECKTQGCKWNR